MNPHCFVIRRPDGFAGVEVHVDDQLEPAEVREFAASLSRRADEVDPAWLEVAAPPEDAASCPDLTCLVSRDGGCRACFWSSRWAVTVSFESAGADAVAAAWACDLARAVFEARIDCRGVTVAPETGSSLVVLRWQGALPLVRRFFGLEVAA